MVAHGQNIDQRVAQQQRAMMRLALREARRGLGRTSPNPLVGAVVVKGGRVLAVGYHLRAGTAHAEIMALESAGAAAKGADLYVTLEPCAHHGRTPPCTEAILRSGIRRVMIGMVDPNPLVNGRGLHVLRQAGIECLCGIEQEACAKLNEPFITAMTLGRPMVTLKLATTLDGRIATRTGDARWVTGEPARQLVHKLRREHDALLVGLGTVLADDPALTCRAPGRKRDPIRVIVDSRLRTPVEAQVVQISKISAAPTWIVTTQRAAQGRVAALERAGAKVWRLEAAADGRVTLTALLGLLQTQGVLSVLLEGGATLAAAFWQQQLVDRLLCFIAPKILADEKALPMFHGGAAMAQMAQATGLKQLMVRRVGDDLLIGGRVSWPDAT